jgi:type VI secretion system protein ImpJ
MSWTNRVAWQEGMFLRAQHFQQQDRWTEATLRARVAALRPYPWGLTRLAINRGLLATGRFAVQDAAGVFEDGTSFDLSADADLPPPLDLPPGTRTQMVYLAVPIGQPGLPEIAAAGAETRWALADFSRPSCRSAGCGCATCSATTTAPGSSASASPASWKSSTGR